MIPTSLAPLSEVENDHRIFLPMIGLCLSAAWLANRIYERWPKQSPWAALTLIALMIVGTHQRNFVWYNEETLWTDCVIKSPHNGRALMNYGLVLASKGDYNGALRVFAMAEYWVPTYSVLRLNEGSVLTALGRDEEAEQHFIEAIRLAPRDAQVHWHFSQFLRSHGKIAAADAELKQARECGADWVDSL
jgi:tetratricopeptide (TPR) repeat protein